MISTVKWDRVHNREADIYTPPEDVIELTVIQEQPVVTFDTLFEEGCIALTKPNADGTGNFIGLDSDRVECEFNVKMIVRGGFR
jgi:hypothetical protein